jgi:hypothetical protein
MSQLRSLLHDADRAPACCRSALLLHEPVGARDLGGLAAIALGMSLVQRS